MTLAVAGGAVAVAWAAGAAEFHGNGASIGAILAAAGVSALTSTLEDLRRAGGGLGLAIGAFGWRPGVLVLELVCAAWRHVPVFLQVGLFPDLEAGPPGMIIAFVAACLIYRELLTGLRLRAQTWLAAAAGHAAPNIVLSAFMASGLGGFHGAEGWVFFPAPGSLVFPALAVGAVLVLRWTRRPADDAGSTARI